MLPHCDDRGQGRGRALDFIKTSRTSTATGPVRLYSHPNGPTVPYMASFTNFPRSVRRECWREARATVAECESSFLRNCGPVRLPCVTSKKGPRRQRRISSKNISKRSTLQQPEPHNKEDA